MTNPADQPEVQPRFVSPNTAAQLLGLSVPTILRMCRQGQINARKFRKNWRIPMTAIDDLEHHDIPLNTEP